MHLKFKHIFYSSSFSVLYWRDESFKKSTWFMTFYTLKILWEVYSIHWKIQERKNLTRTIFPTFRHHTKADIYRHNIFSVSHGFCFVVLFLWMRQSTVLLPSSVKLRDQTDWDSYGKLRFSGDFLGGNLCILSTSHVSKVCQDWQNKAKAFRQKEENPGHFGLFFSFFLPWQQSGFLRQETVEI